jgi:hypothetical protein
MNDECLIHKLKKNKKSPKEPEENAKNTTKKKSNP